MNRFVLDSSYAISWVIAEERTPSSLKCFEALNHGKLEALVPSIWCDELANVFLTVERSRKMSTDQVTIWTRYFRELPLEIHPATVLQSLDQVRPLAQTHGLSVYDATYLHLAMREQVPLATLDRQLGKAAQKAGVELLR